MCSAPSGSTRPAINELAPLPLLSRPACKGWPVLFLRPLASSRADTAASKPAESPIIPAVNSILDSIRVVEMTEALAGPYCAMLLGDFGADVIKVERPSTGDQSRSWGPPFVGTESAYFLAANRNKRSVSLDYDLPRDADTLSKLIATADVFLTNQPSLNSLRNRGLDPETLRARHPRLIHCSITGYGYSGPKAGLPGYDILAQAESGLMSFTGEPGAGPMRYPIAIADMTCGMYAAMGILAALFVREKTGQGQFLDMALFDSQLAWLANAGSSYLNAGVIPSRWGNAHPNIVPYQMFPAADGRYFVVGVGTEALWKKFVALLQSEKTLGIDPRFSTNALRIDNRADLLAVLETRFRSQPAQVWLDQFAASEIPAAPVNGVAQALADVQTRARGLIVEIEHPTLGIARSIANPIRFSATAVTYRLPPPLLGEHTAEIAQSLKVADSR